MRSISSSCLVSLWSKHSQVSKGKQFSATIGHRIISVLLLICLLASNTPAAPRTIVELAETLPAEIGFWLKLHDIGPRLLNLLPYQRAAKTQEKQADRDPRVQRIEIFPGDITLEEGQRANFTAVAYDGDNNSIGGVKFDWQAIDQERGRKKYISARGDFKATVTGNFRVSVEGAGHSSSVRVKVIEGRRRYKGDDKPIKVRPVSTRELPEPAQARNVGNLEVNKRPAGESAKTKLAHTAKKGTKTAKAPMYFMDDGWGDSNWQSADDPGNRVGNPAGSPSDQGAGSGNFQLTAPVLSLPGRADLKLALVYNSRLWNKNSSNNTINYDIDRDWPAPGWNLGFGKMQAMGVYNGAMLIDPDGTRHGYAGSVTVYNWGTNFVGHTTDGTMIDYSYTSGTNGIMLYGQATLSNGTRIDYTSNGPSGLYPTRITDPNGNFITITYFNNTGPRIFSITDTLNRTITFHYDSSTRLTAITAPGLDGGTRTLVRLHYSQLSLSYNFTLTPITRESAPWVIDAIYYPGTNTGYWFSQSENAYSTYGMLKKVSERRGMVFSGSGPVPPWQGPTEQGSFSSAGTVTREQLYNYPLNTSDTTGTQASYLGDAPTYTACTESWTRDGSSTMDQAVTSFQLNQNASPRTITVTLPNGATTTQYSYNSPGSYLDGLIFKDETKSGSTVLLTTTTSWELGVYDSARPTEVSLTNQANQTAKTTFIYGSPSSYNQVLEMRQYDYNGTTVLKSSHVQYQNSATYTSRHIFNLPLVIEVYTGINTARVSRKEYQYDGQTLTNTPGVVMHDDTWNPYFEPILIEGDCYMDCSSTPEGYPCDWVCDPDWWYNPYDFATDYRGNLTQITTYSDAAAASDAITETRSYDITGNLVTASTSCCQKTSFTYDASTQYAYALSRVRGSASDALQQVKTSSTYDFNTGLVTSSTDVNGRFSQVFYDPATLRLQRATLPGGGHTDYVFDDAGLSITETMYAEAHPTHTTVANSNVKLLNGLGQVRQEQALGANSVWDLIDLQYDSVGNLSQQTLPHRSGDTLRWTTTVFDKLGRVQSVQSPDGSLTESFYNESSRPSAASSAAGETVRVKDPWGRERWARNDALGRMVEVVEPDADGSGSVSTNGMVTTYGYNTMGNLTAVTQGDQTRSFKYDSVGRLVAQKLAEKNATLNDSGTYVGAGGTGALWSDVFRYDNHSNLVQHRDARGVKTNFWFFDRTGHSDPGDGTSPDPLGRVQSVTYDTTSDPNHNLASNDPNYYLKVLDAPTITYQYRTKSSGSDLIDVTQLAGVVADQVSTESYHYDTSGRRDIRTLTINGRSSNFVIDYAFDSLDRLSDVTYPAEYGNGSALRKVVHHNFDVASRLSSLTVAGQSHASGLVYNADSRPVSLNVGVAGANQVIESYSYNADSGLLETQKLSRSSTPTSYFRDLTYDYTNSSGKRTGQLVKVLNNTDHTKDRAYEYDAVGRLKRATGGQDINWAQRYVYDRYGNRTFVNSYTAEQYVRNFYQSALNRQPTSTELQAHLANLRTAYAQGQSQFLTAMRAVGVAVFTSSEYNEPNDREFVKDLYHAFLFREPDQSGEDYWTSVVPSNGRSNVRLGFELSPEFAAKANGVSPYAHPSGSAVPSDGLNWLNFQAASNRISDSGWMYDNAGNQTRALIGTNTWQAYQYDADNRLVRVLADNKTTLIASYTYGVGNQRLSTYEPALASGQGLRTYYFADGGAVRAEYTETGSSTTPVWSKSYIYIGNRLLSTLTPNAGGVNIDYHHPDRLGTRFVTNAQNTNVSDQVNMPFGTAFDLESGTPSTNRRFTSYDRSQTTGLDYATNRNYDSRQGRFTQVDPAGMHAVALLSPQSLNLYAYCSNDPINQLDGDGLGILSFIAKLFRAVQKIIKWVVIVLAVFLAVVVVFAVLSLPGTQFLAGMFFKTLGLLLKFMAHAGIIVAGEGGGIAVGLGGKLMAAAMTVGAIANHFQAQKRKKQDTKKKDPIVAVIIAEDGRTVLAELTQEQLDQYKKEQKAYEECVALENKYYEGKIKVIEDSIEKLSEFDFWEFLEFLEKSDDPYGKAKKHMEKLKKLGDLIQKRDQAAVDRDKAIKANCKEPALPH